MRLRLGGHPGTGSGLGNGFRTDEAGGGVPAGGGRRDGRGASAAGFGWINGRGLPLQFAREAPGQAETARLRNALSQLVHHEITVDSVGRRIADELGGEHRFLAFLKDLAEEDRFERPADFADFFLLGELCARGHALEWQIRQVDMSRLERFDVHISE